MTIYGNYDMSPQPPTAAVLRACRIKHAQSNLSILGNPELFPVNRLGKQWTFSQKSSIVLFDEKSMPLAR